jgi:hypothetical protein
MRGRAITRVLVASALVVVGTGAARVPPAGARGGRHCGDIPGAGITPQRIRAYSVRCSRARRLADRVAKVPSFGGCAVDGGGYVRIKPGCRVLGFSCSSRTLVRAHSRIEVRCRRGEHKRVRFRL